MPETSNENKREIAAQLIAQAQLTLKDIAERVGVTYQTLYNWRKQEDFDALVRGFGEEIREEIRRRGIACVENRIAALQDRWERLKLIVAERAASPEMQVAPGGSSGLLARDFKAVGGDKVEVFELDAALLKELREHERQAAIEMGQWGEPNADAGASEIQVRPLTGGATRKKTDATPDASGEPGDVRTE